MSVTFKMTKDNNKKENEKSGLLMRDISTETSRLTSKGTFLGPFLGPHQYFLDASGAVSPSIAHLFIMLSLWIPLNVSSSVIEMCCKLK